MRIDTAGTYTLRYTATDDCGNVATKDRTLTVAAPRSVLYTDGTFIINESPRDMAANEALHGAAINTYAPLSSSGNRYSFASASQRPWHADSASVKSVLIGMPISPTNMNYWFDGMTVLESVTLNNIDGTNITKMEYMFRDCSAISSILIPFATSGTLTSIRGMFRGCSNVATIEFPQMDTSHVTTMYDTFASCSAIEELDLSGWDTQRLQNTGSMFNVCSALVTIYASNLFVTDAITTSSSMFRLCPNLVGGAGTSTSGNLTDKTYARIDNPPDEPGYFTVKPSA